MTRVNQRSWQAWLLIGLGMAAAVCIFLAALAVIGNAGILARVPVPGTNLTLVLHEDEKQLHRYDVLASGEQVARDVLLGSRGALAAPPQVSVLGKRVIVTFHTTENSAPYIELDLAACRIVGHSNRASAPPPIRNCRRG